MIELVTPNYHTEAYDPRKCARLKDRYQQYLYLKYGAKPCDVYVSGEDTIMVFYKDETRELYEKYRNYELK